MSEKMSETLDPKALDAAHEAARECYYNDSAMEGCVEAGIRAYLAASPRRAVEDELVAALERMVALYESEYDPELEFKQPDWLRAALARAQEARS